MSHSNRIGQSHEHKSIKAKTYPDDNDKMLYKVHYLLPKLDKCGFSVAPRSYVSNADTATFASLHYGVFTADQSFKTVGGLIWLGECSVRRGSHGRESGHNRPKNPDVF